MDELKASGTGRILESKVIFYQSVFSESGDWYLHAQATGVVSKESRAATIKGEFRTYAKASALESAPIFRLEFRSDSDLTCATVEGELPMAFPQSLMTLKEVFEKM